MARKTQSKADAERIAESIRAELNIGNVGPLRPHTLLDYLEIPAISLSSLVDGSDDDNLRVAVDQLRRGSSSELSAVTVFRGSRRLIVYNDRHSAERQASDLCHEAAHGLLMHTPTQAIDELGCRSWDAEIEEEAQFLAGALLVPGKGARYAATVGWSIEKIASRFECSTQMAIWRYNMSGGQRVAARQRRH